MSDEWSTVSVEREKMGRELDSLRKHYLEHREALAQLARNAPSDRLADDYARLLREIDASLAKLDELGRGRPSAPASAATPTTVASATPPPRRPATEPGVNATTTQPAWNVGEAPLRSGPAEPMEEPAGISPGTRVLLIGVVGLAVLLVLGYVIYRVMAARPSQPKIVEQPVAEAPAPVPEPKVVETPPLAIDPATFDYGKVRKGTRATHQFRLVNNGDAAMTVVVDRSKCRCLWFEHPKTIPGKGTGTLTVSVDGARAKTGAVSEVVTVSSKESPEVKGTLTVSATIE